MEEQKNEVTVAETHYAHMLDIVDGEAASLSASMLDVLRRASALEAMLELQYRSAERRESPDDFSSSEEKRRDSWKRLIELLVVMADFLDQYHENFTRVKKFLLGDETEGDDNKATDESSAKEEAPTIGFASDLS